jgi:hypothetical protein
MHFRLYDSKYPETNIWCILGFWWGVWQQPRVAKEQFSNTCVHGRKVIEEQKDWVRKNKTLPA